MADRVKGMPILKKSLFFTSYPSFRRKFDDFDFASCLYCGHCELFEENREDCIGNSHPACGGCLWAEGVLSCP